MTKILIDRATAEQTLEALDSENPDIQLKAALALRTVLEQQQAKPVQEPAQWRDMVVVSLVREGVNKHKARELADHFATQPLPVQEPVACRFCHSKKGCWTWQCYNCGEIDDVQQPAPLPVQPVQEPKKRCCDHDSDCAIHNGDALPVGPCDCSQTFISSPDLGIVVTVSYQLAVQELAKLVAENFGQMPRNDEWADKVLLVRDTFEAARNKGAKP